jgi:phosphatidylserine decarboxylase
MGTTAGFAACRDPRVKGMLKKILTVWCEFLSSKDSLHVLNDSPRGRTSDAARAAVGMEQYEHAPDDEHWASRRGTTSSLDGSRTVRVPAQSGLDPGRPKTGSANQGGTD